MLSLFALLVAQSFVVPDNEAHEWAVSAFDDRKISALDVNSITPREGTFVIVQRTYTAPRTISSGTIPSHSSQMFFEFDCAAGTFRTAGGNVSSGQGWTTPQDYDHAFGPIPGRRSAVDHAYRVVCEGERDFGRSFHDFSQVIAVHRMLVLEGRTTLPW